MHFHLNRPVHLARRDVHYEKAVALLCRELSRLSLDERISTVAHALVLLDEGTRHAYFANLIPEPPKSCCEFMQFLELVTGHVESIHTTMLQQRAFEEKHDFLQHFLQLKWAGTRLSLIQARRAEEQLKALARMLRLSEKPYGEMKKACMSRISPSDRDRYNRARKHLEKEVATSDRTAGSVPKNS